jgi:phage gpG-like protein
MAGVRGDFAALARFRARVDGAEQATELRTELARVLGAAAMKQVADSFRLSRDPYGKPWAPVFRNRIRDRRARASRARRGLAARADKPLVDTGRLRAAAVAKGAATPTTEGVRIVIPVEYASFHQTGTGRIRQRQILPVGDMGPIWREALNKAALPVVRRYFRGGKP